MDVDIISNCPYPFRLYLHKLTQNIIIIFDKKLNIIKYNKKLSDILNLDKKEIKNKKIYKFFTSKSQDLKSINLPEESSYQTIKLKFSNSESKKRKYDFFSYIFKLNENYCLIGERNNLEDKEILEKISLLNNELANKTRQLTKKNKKLQKAKERIKKLSKTDELTGLPNRRHFINYLQKIFSQAQRYSQSLSLVMIDLDKFKNINDTYGHDAGDDVLSTLGNFLDNETRKEDLAARIGGEEFIIVLTQTGVNEAKHYAQRIRKKIAELNIESIPINITASLGISTMKNDNNYEAILKRADEALYKAKNSGRNKVAKL